MKIFEVEIDATEDTDENSEKISQIIYSVVGMIGELEEDGRVFKIIIEDSELNSSIQSRYLH